MGKFGEYIEEVFYMMYERQQEEESPFVSIDTLIGSGNKTTFIYNRLSSQSSPWFIEQTAESLEAVSNHKPGDDIIEIARDYIGEISVYDLGAKYDPDSDEYYKWIDSNGDGSLDQREVYEEPTIDCSGFTHKVYNEAGYNLPHGSTNQRNELGTRDQAVVGGLVYIDPPAGGSISHIMIVSEINEQGNPTRIIDASSGNGVQEREWNDAWNNRNPQYLEVLW